MRPTEHEGTVAVEAAARQTWAAHREVDDTEFDDLPPLVQNRLREAVLPTVWAALEALPDRPRFPAGLFLDTDADDEPCVWRVDPARTDTPECVARRCDVTSTAWAILEAAVA